MEQGECFVIVVVQTRPNKSNDSKKETQIRKVASSQQNIMWDVKVQIHQSNEQGIIVFFTTTAPT